MPSGAGQIAFKVRSMTSCATFWQRQSLTALPSIFRAVLRAPIRARLSQHCSTCCNGSSDQKKARACTGQCCRPQSSEHGLRDNAADPGFERSSGDALERSCDPSFPLNLHFVSFLSFPSPPFHFLSCSRSCYCCHFGSSGFGSSGFWQPLSSFSLLAP